MDNQDYQPKKYQQYSIITFAWIGESDEEITDDVQKSTTTLPPLDGLNHAYREDIDMWQSYSEDAWEVYMNKFQQDAPTNSEKIETLLLTQMSNLSATVANLDARLTALEGKDNDTND